MSDNRKLYLRSNQGVVNGGVDTDITFAITPPLTTSDFFNFTLTLESAEIPISFYNVNSSNNTFTYHLISSGVESTITIPVKNYSATQLLTVLNSLLSSLSVAVTYDEQINRYTFTGSADFKLKGNAFRLLGLFPDATTFNLSSSNILVSPSMINLLFPRNCFLQLISTQATTYNSTIAKVQLSAEDLQVVYFNGTIASEFSVLLSDRTLTSIRVSLVDDDGLALGAASGLNGIYWSLGLNVETVNV
tara:strand:- start:1055 stop:1795 length:741 start_codon:yes stop_codon:yes gene_type:complete